MIGLGGWLAALVLALWLVRLRTVLAARMGLVARACHELRGPITVATLALERALGEGGASADALRALDLELAMVRVAVEDLSAAVAGSPGSWRPQAFEVNALLDDSLAAFRPLALERGVDLRVRWRGRPAVVEADRIRVAQATRNLIANAIEHGRGRVELCGKADADGVEIEVSDEGGALPAPVADLRARSLRNRGRRGHGLAIASEVAHRHGGTLETAAGSAGTRVALRLPLRPR
jgi:signal transduction histidine kinase